MGHTTTIPDAELLRGDPVIDPAGFNEVVTKAKVVAAEEDKPPVSTTRDVKSK